MLSPAQEALVRLSAALATRDRACLEEALRTAERAVDPEAVEEAILQSYLFLGYPAALNAFGAWREISGRPAAGPAQDQALWAERGAEVCRVVYGGQYDGLRANVKRLHADMERWMIEEGYGKVLGRPGLALLERELCIATLLAVLDTPRQLYSHLRGALNAGATEDQISDALSVAFGMSEEGARKRAAETWDSVRDRERN